MAVSTATLERFVQSMSNASSATADNNDEDIFFVSFRSVGWIYHYPILMKTHLQFEDCLSQ